MWIYLLNFKIYENIKKQERNRSRLILTCNTSKVKMYKKFGFRDLGESASEWGGEKWHEMEIILNY